MMCAGALPGLTNLSTACYRHRSDIEHAYNQLVPLRRFHSLVADHLCLHQLGSARLNGITLTSCTATPHRMAIGAANALHLLLGFAGHTRIEVAQGAAVHCAAGGAVLLPAAELLIEGCHSVALVQMRPTAVAAAAAAMAGEDNATGTESLAFAQFKPRCLPPAAPQARALHSLLRTIDHSLDAGPQLPECLGFDAAILRSVASWLQPELLRPTPAAGEEGRSGRERFDTLLDYICANLHLPLRLCDLEARSHYSRRALEYAFREQLGSSPKQWIRKQRLQKAIKELRQRGGERSIQDVALACGYRHRGHFSRDFKLLFGCTPSEVRRRKA
jgi:AraC-like DNA-binding protein